MDVHNRLGTIRLRDRTRQVVVGSKGAKTMDEMTWFARNEGRIVIAWLIILLIGTLCSPDKDFDD